MPAGGLHFLRFLLVLLVVVPAFRTGLLSSSGSAQPPTTLFISRYDVSRYVAVSRRRSCAPHAAMLPCMHYSCPSSPPLLLLPPLLRRRLLVVLLHDGKRQGGGTAQFVTA